MEIYIETEGDRSVGIWGDEITLKWNIDIPTDPKERQELKESIADCFQELCDNGRVKVWFEDECSDCYQIKDKGICKNKSCISNYEGDKNES